MVFAMACALIGSVVIIFISNSNLFVFRRHLPLRKWFPKPFNIFDGLLNSDFCYAVQFENHSQATSALKSRAEEIGKIRHLFCGKPGEGLVNFWE
jgi:hypothetical protein